MSAYLDLLARLSALAGKPVAEAIAREFEGRIVAFNGYSQAATKDAATPERAQLLAPVLKFPDGSSFDIEADIRVYESSATIWVELRNRGRWVRLAWGESTIAILQLRRELAALRRALQSKSAASAPPVSPTARSSDGSGFDVDADLRIYESTTQMWFEVRTPEGWVRLDPDSTQAILQLRRELAAARRALESKSDGHRV